MVQRFFYSITYCEIYLGTCFFLIRQLKFLISVLNLNLKTKIKIKRDIINKLGMDNLVSKN